MKLRVVAAILVMSLCFCLCACEKEYAMHPFEGLYYDQTRDEVRTMLGEPDIEEFEHEYVKYSWNMDEYKDIKFLGTSGTLYIWYDSENLVSHAFWDCEPSYADAISLSEKLIEHFDTLYGISQPGYYEYEWKVDGFEIGYTPPQKETTGLTPDTLEIQLQWDGFYIEDTIGNSTAEEIEKSYTTDDIRSELVGLWLAQTDYGGFGYIFRADGSVLKRSLLGSTTLPDVTGTFEILEDGRIKCINSSGSSTKYLEYTFTNNRLRLYEDGVEMEKD